jgi:hypothetical protein
MLPPKPGEWRVAVRQADGTAEVQSFPMGSTSLVNEAPLAAADAAPPTAAERRLQYFDDDETRRVAKALPRLLLLQQQQQQQQTSSTVANSTTSLLPPPPVSGKARAREEIFLRRAQLAAQLNHLHLPPMVDLTSSGRSFQGIVFLCHQLDKVIRLIC